MSDAYDYDSQQWVEGSVANTLLIAQQAERLALLEGPRGAEYCQMIGKELSAELSNARAALASL